MEEICTTVYEAYKICSIQRYEVVHHAPKPIDGEKNICFNADTGFT